MKRGAFLKKASHNLSLAVFHRVMKQRGSYSRQTMSIYKQEKHSASGVNHSGFIGTGFEICVCSLTAEI